MNDDRAAKPDQADIDNLLELIGRSYMPADMKARAAAVVKDRIRTLQTLDAD